MVAGFLVEIQAQDFARCGYKAGLMTVTPRGWVSFRYVLVETAHQL
jgi:hypothetical protein